MKRPGPINRDTGDRVVSGWIGKFHVTTENNVTMQLRAYGTVTYLKKLISDEKGNFSTVEHLLKNNNTLVVRYSRLHFFVTL